MGREIRRVALDFDWPLNKTYEGFINPHPYGVKCPDPTCDNGSSPDGQLLKNRWYGKDPNWRPEHRGSKPFTPDDEVIKLWSKRQCEHTPSYYGTGPAAELRESRRICTIFNSMWMHHLNQDDVDVLIKEGRLHRFTHDWQSDQRKWVEKSPPVRPTAKEVNDAYIFGMGHDSINCWVVIGAEAARLGLKMTCETCGGDGVVWDSLTCSKEAYEAWEPYDPPAGEGWQIWETVTEGSPITPVFATSQALADHMAEVGDPVWGKTRTAAQWLKWIEGDGYAPSMIMSNGVVQSGVEALTNEN